MVEGVDRTLSVPVTTCARSLRENLVEGVVDTGVVALAAEDCTDTFPAASYAATVYEYAVEAVRPVSEYEVAEGVAICVPFRKTR